MNKLRARSGETLVEVLAAILIFTMSSIILLTMSTTAADINTKTRAAQEANEEQMVYAEQGPDAEGAIAQSGTATVTICGETLTVPVDIYSESGDNTTFYSYFKKPANAS